ncbi:MAG: Beta-barrel assembly-enhancing protease [Alphaproteobacteria bacterium MarineAlpha4_Bin2]|nr:MAG: Beta-barrel assembly-enhancing protease [Alphaproteobacteria bacterium MarineAlpha4_Bin2]
MVAKNPSMGAGYWRAIRFSRQVAVGSLLVLSACIGSENYSSPKLVDASRIPVLVEGEPYEKSIFGSYLAGRFAEKLQDLSTAAELINRVFEDDPENDQLLRRAFILFLASGQIDQAMKLAEILAERNVGTTVSLLLLAAREIKLGRYGAAQTWLEDMPTRGLAKYSLPVATAWIKAGLGNFAAAINSLEHLSKQSGFESLINLHIALLHEIAGRPGAALEVYAEATKDMSKVPLRMVRAMGTFLEGDGKVEEARNLYEKYLENHPTSYLMVSEMKRLKAGVSPKPIAADASAGFAEGMFNLASALPLTRAGAHSLLYARLATYLQPNFPVAQLLMGDILDHSKRHTDSIAIYRSITRNSPYSWLARLKMAVNLDRADRIQEAKSLLEEMAKERPTEIEPLVRLGNFLRVREDFAEAEQAYNRAFRRLGEPRPNNWSLYYYRGISRERLKKWEQAEKDFLKALELNPDQPYVLNYLGYSWVDQGINLDQAREMIERAVEQRRNDGYIVDSMGWVLYRLGDYEDAVKHLERAVELRPLDPIISDHLGDAYWRVGRHHEARFQWRRALSLNPEKEDISKIEAKLEKGLAPPKENLGPGR